MSNQTPNNPRRRRIAGERKSGRPLSPGAAGPPEEPSPPPPPPPPSDDQAPEPPSPSPEPPAPGEGAGLPVIVGLAVTFVVLVVVVSAIAFLPMIGWWHTVRTENSEQKSAQAAPASAERAAEAILSYDYKALDTDKKSAVRFMTGAYGKKYAKTFDSLVRANATKLHAKVAAKVAASGVSNASADRANVLLFVDQTTTSTANGGDPQTALNRVMFKMVNRDGTWLVDGITSY
jgi:Mce-associated membrane protein